MGKKESATEAFIAFIILLIGAAAAIAILSQANKTQSYVCSRCNSPLQKGTVICPNCGTEVRWLPNV